ncbi:hypothetical protein EJB05_01742, partial [Eragrostis curvula]
MAAAASPPPPAARGWASLQSDVLWSVFLSLGQREVLRGAGLACAPWWRLARDEPALWRRIDLTAPADDEEEDGILCYIITDKPGWKEMACAAVDRSAGQCEAFWGRADDEVLRYLADRAPSLKSLRVTSRCDITSKAFTELIKKLPLLEELELVLKPDAYNDRRERPTWKYCWAELFQSACGACRHLQCFTVCHADIDVGMEGCAHRFYRTRRCPKPFSIPIMHGLRSVHLCGDSFTRDMVLSIADNCPGLESLNISDMGYLRRWNEELQNKFSRIKDLRLPCYDSDSGEMGIPTHLFD